MKNPLVMKKVLREEFIEQEKAFKGGKSAP